VKTFEYARDTCVYQDEIDMAIASRGSQGWELVAIIDREANSIQTYTHLYFKREKIQ
jgi:hypothetical protein